MRCNVGNVDRVLRLVVAAVLLAALFFVEALAFKLVLGLVAFVMAATAFVRFCPLYRILGMTTCKREPT